MASTTLSDMAQGLTVDQLQKMGAKPSGGLTLDQLQSQNPQQAPKSSSFWDKLAGGAEAVTNTLGLKGAVDTIGTNLANVGNVLDPTTTAKQKLEVTKELPQTSLKQNVGAGLSLGSTLSSFAAPGTATLGKTAAQFGGLSAAQAGGSALAEGKDLGTAAKDAAISGATGAATGAVFNLAGKAISKLAPTAASVTSGVPKAAIEQAGVNPSVTKQGVGMNVEEVRNKAVSSLQSLYNDLSKEHTQGTAALSDITPANTQEIASKLTQKAQDIASQFKVIVGPTAEGLGADFSKSAIVNPGEENVVKKAIQTVSTWDDFSPKGLQTLNQRINALKNYDSAAVTKSSAIVGKIHDAIGDIIKSNSPELATINENFSKNKKVLDNISSVIGGDARTPTQIQSAVTRLDNIFKENRDEYVNIIKQLGDRSGTDYLSLLAGGEFQKLLPGYIRSAVAVGSVGGVGAVATNPMSLLLLPLFSPRAVGAVARNAPAIAKTAAPLIRAAATQSIPQIQRSGESQ